MIQGSFKIVDGVLERYTGNDSVVTIPKGITSIGGIAFLWGKALKFKNFFQKSLNFKISMKIG